jgi:hypothetical protein
MFFRTEPNALDLLGHSKRDPMLFEQNANLNDTDVVQCICFNIEDNLRSAPILINNAVSKSSLSNYSCPSGYRLALITEWGIWPSSEDWYLYYLMRSHHGDRQMISEAPGHVFLGHERSEYFAFTRLFMQFGWGGIFAGNLDSIAYSLDHDGNVRLLNFSDQYDVSDFFIEADFAIEVAFQRADSRLQ